MKLVSRRLRSCVQRWLFERRPLKFASRPVEDFSSLLPADNPLPTVGFPRNVCQQDAEYNGQDPLAGEDEHGNAKHNQAQARTESTVHSSVP